MASSGSDGLLFINLSNKTGSPSKSFPCPVPLTLHARGASGSLPLSQALSPAVPVQRYSQSIAAAAANSNISPKRARGEPAPPPLYFPRKSKIYPIMDSSPFSVNVISPQPDVQMAEAVPALEQGSLEYDVPLPHVEAVIAEAASVSTRWEARFASSWRPVMFATTTSLAPSSPSPQQVGQLLRCAADSRHQVSGCSACAFACCAVCCVPVCCAKV